jgi:cytochrome P450
MDSVDVEPVQFNPFQPGFAENPYPTYARLREEDPVHQSPFGAWVLSRYDDVDAFLRDRRASSQGLFNDEIRETVLRAMGLWDAWKASVIPSTLAATLLFKDPPDHTRLRNLVAKAFTPRAVAELEPRVHAIVDQLLATGEESGRLEVIGDLAFPLPALVICELLGVPVEDRDRMRDWSGAGARLVEPFMTPEEFPVADQGLRHLLDYFAALVEERRKRPRADLLSSLIAAEEEGDRLTTNELLVTAVLLFAAGHETTKNLIGTAVLTLLRHPDQLARLRADPGLINTAVEEFLRYEPPVQVTARVLSADMDVKGVTIEAGSRVVVVLGAANRDPVHFNDPERFDIGRLNNRPISFGSGIHFCLGSALARLESRIAIGALVQRFPTLELAGEARLRNSFTLRGLESLPLAVAS